MRGRYNVIKAKRSDEKSYLSDVCCLILLPLPLPIPPSGLCVNEDTARTGCLLWFTIAGYFQKQKEGQLVNTIRSPTERKGKDATVL